MLGIEGIGLVHAAGQDWFQVKKSMAYANTPLSTKQAEGRDVEGMFLPALPQPAVPNGRRFSPWLKMALAAGQACLRPEAATVQAPEIGVIGATTMGSLQHTAAFVENMIRNREEGPQPANFILSVHNAATAQLAIALKAKGYSNTVCHDETSFEQALMIAHCQLVQNPDSHFVVVGADEWIPLLHDARIAAGCWAADAGGSPPIAAEGAVALWVRKPQPDGIRMKVLQLRKFPESPGANAAKAAWIAQGVQQAGIPTAKINLIMTLDPHEGVWGNLPELARTPRRLCRHWLGTFGMANGFVIAAAAALLGAGEGKPDPVCQLVENILIYHQSGDGQVSLAVVGR